MTGDITNPADIEDEMDRLVVRATEESAKVLALGKHEAEFKLAAEKLYADAFLKFRVDEGKSVAESEQRAKLAAREMSHAYEETKNQRQDRRTIVSVIDRQLTVLMSKMREARP